MRSIGLFEGCYDAHRAGALAGVPVSTLYDWARKGVVVPTVSQARPKLWSYADLMSLRIVYWLRHPKLDDDGSVPASPMPEVRRALEALESDGIDLWSMSEAGHTSALVVDRGGRIVVMQPDPSRNVDGQGFLSEDMLDVLGPFDSPDSWGPDLRQPAPHLRIVPGKVSGEPHLEHSRLTSTAVAALAHRGFDLAAIQRMYPEENAEGLREAIELEDRLAA
jgi:uncharacterized protein (DUF433 family)